MRFTRFSSFAATAALGAATVLGGAGIAQADSLGSLTAGSSAPAPLVLNLDEANKDGAKGSFTNQTEAEVKSCTVTVSTAEFVRKLDDLNSGGKDIASSKWTDELSAEYALAGAAGQNFQANDLDAEAGKEKAWTGTKVGEATTAEDYQAGAWVQCMVGEKVEYAFDYEEEASTGSLDNILGSLGSSNDDATEGDDKGEGKKDDTTGSLSSLTAGSSNEDEKATA